MKKEQKKELLNEYIAVKDAYDIIRVYNREDFEKMNVCDTNYSNHTFAQNCEDLGCYCENTRKFMGDFLNDLSELIEDYEFEIIENIYDDGYSYFEEIEHFLESKLSDNDIDDDRISEIIKIYESVKKEYKEKEYHLQVYSAEIDEYDSFTSVFLKRDGINMYFGYDAIELPEAESIKEILLYLDEEN